MAVTDTIEDLDAKSTAKYLKGKSLVKDGVIEDEILLVADQKTGNIAFVSKAPFYMQGRDARKGRNKSGHIFYSIPLKWNLQEIFYAEMCRTYQGHEHGRNVVSSESYLEALKKFWKEQTKTIDIPTPWLHPDYTLFDAQKMFLNYGLRKILGEQDNYDPMPFVFRPKEQRPDGILNASGVGVGKTLGSLALLFALLANRIHILVPGKLIFQWKREIERFIHPDWLPPIFIASGLLPEDRQAIIRIANDTPRYILIVSHETWRNDQDFYNQLPQCQGTIWDESSKIMNPDAAITQAALNAFKNNNKSKVIIELNGTPISKGPQDYWTQLSLINGLPPIWADDFIGFRTKFAEEKWYLNSSGNPTKKWAGLRNAWGLSEILCRCAFRIDQDATTMPEEINELRRIPLSPQSYAIFTEIEVNGPSAVPGVSSLDLYNEGRIEDDGVGLESVRGGDIGLYLRNLTSEGDIDALTKRAIAAWQRKHADKTLDEATLSKIQAAQFSRVIQNRLITIQRLCGGIEQQIVTTSGVIDELDIDQSPGYRRNFFMVIPEKLDALIDYINENPEEKIMVTCRYNCEVEAIGRRLAQEHVPHHTIYDVDDNESADRKLNEVEHNDINVLVTQVLRVYDGLNLQFVDTTVFYSIVQRPLVIQQLKGRNKRPGRTRPVKRIYFTLTDPQGNDLLDYRIYEDTVIHGVNTLESVSVGMGTAASLKNALLRYVENMTTISEEDKEKMRQELQKEMKDTGPSVADFIKEDDSDNGDY